MALPDLYVFGAGNPGVVKILEAVQRAGPRFAAMAFLDDDEELWGEVILGLKVAGGMAVLEEADPARTVVLNNVARDTKVRRKVTEKLKAAGIPFAGVVHPGVDAGHVTLGADVMVSEGAILGARAVLGDHVIVRNQAVVNHDCRLGDHVFVGPGAVMASRITVGEGAFIGTGAAMVPGVSIGAWSTVGAGAVVTKDVPEGGVVVGNPARPVRSGEGG